MRKQFNQFNQVRDRYVMHCYTSDIIIVMQIFWLDHYFLCLENFLQKDFLGKILLDSY